MVTFEAGYLARTYIEDTQLKWPLLVDEDRELYHGYGMLTASFWDIWGPRTWWVYAKALYRGEKLKQSDGDISQRGGDVLINAEGKVVLHHVGDGPADRPSIRDLLQGSAGPRT